MFAVLHPAIAHLSIEQIKQLHSRYLAGEKVYTLLDEYQIKSTSNHLQGLLPLKILSAQLCPGCDQPLLQKWETKSSGVSEPFCKPCGHIKNGNCHCTACRAERISVYNGKWAFEHLPYSALTLRDKILLLALIWQPDHSRATINRFQGAGEFCTSTSGSLQYIKQLRRLGAIKLVYAENWLSDIESVVEYSLENTAWRSNVSSDDNPNAPLSPEDLIAKLNFDLDNTVDEFDYETLTTLIEQISVEDAFQYSAEQLSKQNLEMTADAKTRETLSILLETTAMESVCAAAWEAAKSVGKALDSGVAKNRRHASNMFPNTLKKRVEARVSKPDAWKVQRSPFHVSRISRILHDRIFGGDDAIVSWPLSRYYNEVVMPRLIYGKRPI
ncbi:hypothetical protein [Pseudomonas siliginis]|uniref:hypothetical protein n=1 Tax=Pseudomonas siliginis TaxID=2842346 RepID=UPI00209388A8|nr:hypothetical protein [Pseudomonas siliginis]UST92746.1 hypothetical protein NF678_12755 [Pseudomonas siliginis]